MTRQTAARRKRIVEDLRAQAVPEPPAGLEEALRRDVPEELELAPEVSGAGEGGRPGRRYLLAAASVVLAVGAGVVGLRVMERVERPALVQEPSGDAAARPSAGAADHASRETLDTPADRTSAGDSLGPLPEAPPAGHDKQESPVPGARPEDRATALEVSLSDAVEEVVTVTSEAPRIHESNAAIGETSSRRARKGLDDPVQRREAAAAVPPSTGGTAEPNDRPYGDVFFRAYGTHPFLDPAEDPLSTFALDVDTGSWGTVRRYLSDGHLPPPEAVRVEEVVNAFDYGDPAPDEGDFALLAEGSRSPFAGGPHAERYHLVRFGLRARVVAPAERAPAVLTFVVDVSGSMARGDRLGLVRRALDLLLSELREDDRVGLVIYGSRGRVLLEPTGDLEAIRRALQGLAPGGSTNAEEGLGLGYELAREAFRQGGVNRVILCSDGVANVGATGAGSILERIGEEARRGIELTTVGFGMGNYNDVLMEQLADRGDGAYAYVDDLSEARRVFVEELTGTLQTVARDARVQVELDPDVVERYRLLGYENRDVPDERFRDDTVDAGEVGAGHGVTALYEVKLRPEAAGDATAATLRLRYRSAATGEVEELELPVTAGELRRPWEEAPSSLRLASVAAELAEILRGSYWAKDGDLDELFRRAQAVSAQRPGDVRAAELAALVGRAAELRQAQP